MRIDAVLVCFKNSGSFLNESSIPQRSQWIASILNDNKIQCMYDIFVTKSNQVNRFEVSKVWWFNWNFAHIFCIVNWSRMRQNVCTTLSYEFWQIKRVTRFVNFRHCQATPNIKNQNPSGRNGYRWVMTNCVCPCACAWVCVSHNVLAYKRQINW